MVTRSGRDYNALVWAVKSLADDTELESLVEVIPDVLWGPTRRRYTYEVHIRGLINNQDVQLLDRITTLLDSCGRGILTLGASQRRIIICYKALWAIASLSMPNHSSDRSNIQPVDLAQIYKHIGYARQNADIATYYTPARALMLWSMFCVVEKQLIKHRESLATPRRYLDAATVHPLLNIYWEVGINIPVPWELDLIDKALSELPHRIRVAFLVHSARLESPPYRWEEMHSMIRVSDPIPASLKDLVEASIDLIISAQNHRLKAGTDGSETRWIIDAIEELVSFWRPNETDSIPGSIILFLNCWDSDLVLWNVPGRHDVAMRLWKCFPRTLSTDQREGIFTALWRLASDAQLYDEPSDVHLAALESVLKTVSIADSPFTLIAYSITACMKVKILREINARVTTSMGGKALFWVDHHLFPAETASQIGDRFHLMEGEISNSERTTMINFSNRVFTSQIVDEYRSMVDKISDSVRSTIIDIMRNRVSEALLIVIAEYLEHCACDSLPYKAVETFAKIGGKVYTPTAANHPTHQIRLANSIHNISSSEQATVLLDVIVDCQLWNLYAEGTKTEVLDSLSVISEPDEYWPWLANHEARYKIMDAFSGYEKKMMSTAELSRDVLPRLQKILRGLDSWHTESGQSCPAPDAENK
ncbi:hypothetical protein B0H19DRAFT_1267041 [Mycena capillaripes]|nr:hypothetical protein B0H19DRAFT_1267041 [Mycena capillaripes]